ncbi:MAG: hypothetical protein ACK58T_38270 [Phycisphaerae bacterium]|jgi:altronate dehydratase
MSVKLFIAILGALPEILKLLKELSKDYEKPEVKEKLKADIEAINKAFKEKDEKLLNNIFNGRKSS